MSEPSAPSLDVAFQLIDAVTRIKGVLGAMLVELDGQIIAQDFLSQAEQDRCWPIGTELVPKLLKGTTQLEFGSLEEVLIQTANMTLRFLRHDRVWLAIFADESVNLGMLNVELRELHELLHLLVGGAVISERDAERERVLDMLRSDGNVEKLIEERSEDIPSLRALHGVLFQMAIDFGISRQAISHRINDINYRLYRDSLLDIGFDFFNRKALDNYDPALSRKVVSAQIGSLGDMIIEKMQQ